MKPRELTKVEKEKLISICGAEASISLESEMEVYTHDETEDFRFVPALVLKPESTNQVSQIMAYCNEKKIPVTPRAAGTGLSGGALCIYGGVLLSVERMNKILEIDTQNFIAVVEPGVINEVLQNAVQEKSLFYPPDPASKGSSMLGGNVSENAGGPKAVKYGVTGNYVLNLEVVLPTGEVIHTGANTLKNVTGYDLTSLFTGSEGTLGVITKIYLRLIPLPKHNMLMVASFNKMEDACSAVASVMIKGITPSAIEFMERSAVEWSMKYSDVNFNLEDSTEAILLIETDGNDKDVLFKECQNINAVLESYESCHSILFAETESEKERLWKVRRNAGHAVHANSVYKEEDTVVPRAKLPVLLKGIKKIGEKYGFETVCYGHAGDGNLHVNIIKSALDENAWNTTVKIGIREIFKLCKALGGTITGEHGVGYVQKEYLDIVFSPVEMAIMKKLKLVFDPNGIMNPGKIFD